MATRIAVIYYSATGNVHKLAEAIAEGAGETGAEVRLRRVQELAPEEAIQQNQEWARHRDETAESVEIATLDDLEWAHGYAFGTPTRFGNPAAQLKQYLDMAGGLWFAGALSDKAVTTFTSAMYPDGGLESTILALNNVFYHWGCVLVPPGYTSPASSRQAATRTARRSRPARGRPRTRCWPPRVIRGGGWPRSRPCSPMRRFPRPL